MMRRTVLVGLLAVMAGAGAVRGQVTAEGRRFGFLPGGEANSLEVIDPEQAYSAENGVGFDLGSRVRVESGSVRGVGGKPWFFSVKAAPGVYEVSVTLGGKEAAETTVKAETRRLMVERAKSGAGEGRVEKFLVHVRVPEIAGASGAAARVALKPRERDPILYVQWDVKDAKTLVPFTELNWDEKLTLEFSGETAAVSEVEIRPAAAAVRVFIIGDSTVTDQMMEPWGGWGQQLPRFFKMPVVVANYAESGETTASFISERRWAKVLTEMQAGDFVLMQFGINDQRMALPAFKANFVKFIEDTKAKGAVPVLVTSQNLKRLSPEGKGVQTLGEFPAAMKEAAAEKGAAFVDLNAMSAVFYEALGKELDKAFVDGTHHTMYGSYELAKCVVEGLVKGKTGLEKYVVEEWRGFDPGKPDAVAGFMLPVDPQMDPARPGGPGLPNGQGPMAGAPARPAATTTRP